MRRQERRKPVEKEGSKGERGGWRVGRREWEGESGKGRRVGRREWEGEESEGESGKRRRVKERLYPLT